MPGIIRIFALMVSIGFLHQSCLRDNFKFKKLKGFWRPDMAVPLVSSDLSLQDVLTISSATNSIITNPDNSLTLIYKGQLFSIKAEDALVIPDLPQPIVMPRNLTQSEANTINALPISGTFPIPSYSAQIPFNVIPHRIDSVDLKGGFLTFNLQSGIPMKVDLVFTIPGLIRNGLPVTQSLTLNAASAGQITQVPVTIDLTNTRLITQGIAPNTSIQVDFSGTITKTGTLAVMPGQGIIAQMNYTQIRYRLIYGGFNFGQQQLAPYQDTVAISLFNNVSQIGDFEFTNPRFTLRIQNSFGLDLPASLDVFKSYNSLLGAGSNTVDIIFPFNPVVIPGPDISSIGSIDTISFYLDDNNSNVSQALAIAPRDIIYRINNNPQPPPPGNQFLMDTSRFKVDLDVTLPLEGKIESLVFQDTLEFSFQDVEALESISFLLNTRNGFPLDATMQLYMADEDGYVMDSLLTTQSLLLEGAPVDGNGVVTGVSEVTTKIDYPSNKINRLEFVRKLYIRAKTSTTGAQSGTTVKFYSTYRLGVKLSAKAQLRIAL